MAYSPYSNKKPKTDRERTRKRRRDYVLAHMRLNLAAAAGDAHSATARDELQKIMTPSQIEEAQRLAREWNPQKP